jgi:hypothetical protein
MGSSCPPRPCVRASSVLLDVERAPGSLPVRVFPPLAGPSHRETRVHSAVERTPFRVLRPPYSTVRPLGRSRPPLRFPCPSTASSRQPLYGAGCSIPAPVPLSGFLNLSAVSASSSSTALFRAATVPGLLPSEPSPHRDRVPLSRPLAPLRSSTDVLDAPPSSPCHHRFPRRPRFRRSCLVPPATMGSLFTSRGPLPGRPGQMNVAHPFRQLHPLRSFAPPVSPFAPSPGCPGWAAAALLGFIPSRVRLRTSEPRTLRGDSTPASGEPSPSPE